MNRGAARQPIFFTAADGERFEDLLGRCVARYGVEVHAHCLMTNHFHLLVRCPEGGLSDFMHDVSAQYARYANDRKGTDGPLFRGRFRSLLVDTDAYLSAVGRYIHRNPKDLPGEMDLVEYRWSSLRCYAGRSPAPDWLTTSVLSAPHGNSEAYLRFVCGDAGTAGPVRWAVATALAECDDGAVLVEGHRLARSVAAAMLDVARRQFVPTSTVGCGSRPRGPAPSLGPGRDRAPQRTISSRRSPSEPSSSAWAQQVPGT